MENITSKSNKKVQYIKSLNEKKYRLEYMEYYLEGIKVVNELLDMYETKAVDIMSIACSYEILTKSNGGIKLYERLESLENIEVIDINENIFNTIVDTVNTQGVLAVLKIKENSLEEILNINKENNLEENFLIIDKIQDAGNLGTIIRTADSFKVKNIICLEGTVDSYSQKVLRSTMASILRVNIIKINKEEVLSSIELLKKNNYKIVVTSLQTEEYINDKIFKDNCVFVVGNESNGVSEEILDIADIKVKIPMENTAESLNVAVATSILLYEQYKNNL